MADKGASSSKAVGIVADMGAFYVVRWLLAFGWKQVTGREPPTDPEDLHRGIGESLAWAVILGVSTEIVRLLAVRLAARRVRARHPAS
jgi:uncharacterized protein DUF4235